MTAECRSCGRNICFALILTYQHTACKVQNLCKDSRAVRQKTTILHKIMSTCSAFQEKLRSMPKLLGTDRHNFISCTVIFHKLHLLSTIPTHPWHSCRKRRSTDTASADALPEIVKRLALRCCLQHHMQLFRIIF